jgi:DNA polymerase I
MVLKMKLQIIDIDYYVNKNTYKPIIRIFGRAEDGKSIQVNYSGFKPYFYVQSEVPETSKDLKRLLKNKYRSIQNIEIVERYEPIGYQKQKTKMLKVFVDVPKSVSEIRDEILKQRGIKNVYEADIMFHLRFMSDMDIGGTSWIEVDDSKVKSAPPQNKSDYIANVISFRKLDVQHNSDIRFLGYDIECLPNGNKMPTPDVSPIIMISCAFSHEYEGHKAIVLVAKNVENTDDDVYTYNNESEMLRAFFKVITEYDPDIISGYNIDSFDNIYVIDRINKLNEMYGENHIKPLIGKVDDYKGNFTYREFNDNKFTKIQGRIIADALPLVRKEFKLKRYTLKNVSKELLSQEKLDVEASQMKEYWEDDGKKILEFIDYSRRDSELALEIITQFKLLDKYFALARVSHALMHDVINGGQSGMIEQVLLNRFGKADRVMAPKPNDKEVEERKIAASSFKGATVLPPSKGLHENVMVLDYKSLYPTIIISHNLCYTTIVDPGEYPSEMIIETTTGGEFVKPQICKGIMPKFLEYLLSERTSVKKKMKNETDENLYNVLDATQLALKILLNSFYGYTGYARSRLFTLQIATSVTGTGRSNIEKTENIICNEIKSIIVKNGKAYPIDDFNDSGMDFDPDTDIKADLSVVYGDTDSVFMHCTPPEGGEFDEIELGTLKIMGDKASEIITGTLPSPMELEFESVAKRILLLAKKRYAYHLFEPSGDGWKNKIKVKGLETVRRDWCELTSDTLKKVLDKILKEGDVDGAQDYVDGVVDKVKHVNEDQDEDLINMLVMTKTFSKPMDEYKNAQPHLTVVKKLEKRTGVSPTIGTRIPYLITAGKGKMVDKAEDPEYVKQYPFKNAIDTKYYINKQIVPPTKRILDAVHQDTHEQSKLGIYGLNVSETMNTRVTVSTDTEDNGKQCGLFDFK